MAPTSTTHGLQLDTMNRSVDPRQDFKEFAWGHWIEKNPIPAEYASWGIFHKLRDDVLANLRGLCDDLAANAHSLAPGTPNAHIAHFWASAMDESAVEAAGVSALTPLFARVDAADSVDAFVECAAFLHTRGLGCLYGFSVAPDFKQSDMLRVLVSQGGLGLPDRDYYTDADKAPLLEAYRAYIVKAWTLLGRDDVSAAAVADAVLAVETRLATTSRTRTAMRDLASLYNKRTADELRAAAFPWTAAFRGYDVPLPDVVVEATPEFFLFLATDITVDTLPQYKTYAKWHILRQVAPYLPATFVQANFELAQALSGTKELAPRWKRVVDALNDAGGELMGAVYCDKYFSADAKVAMVDLVGYLKRALAEKIHALEWMTPATKAKSIEKLDAFRAKVGYPDQWLDYSTLAIARDQSFAANMLELKKFAFGEELQRANKAAETWRWEMPPQMVNAYYHPLYNEIVFPAAILQFPAFSPDRDMAMNFGAIGAVIGHEMTHGFDDQGRLFDAKGNMSEWWSAEDAAAFQARTKTVVDQFNGYTVLDKPVNGQLTLGENIADIGGLKIAYRALELYFEDHTKPGPIDGFTAEQRFFLAWAQFWATNTRDEQALRLLSTDVHSPGALRSVVPLKNLPEFYAAFGVQEGDGMYLAPDARAAVW
ncbi:Aste57867_10444 [Aphanomyces stellatus]|uniref:Aste57867_10444 protein n=1 Tax=Aphanomyces stellatus TaxID=120398 RepID=A0A485KQV5_9STRA|nr:hypothetical protein As57867_010404 [Aphanomyces stellatus]VFT87318.1 Aste57867_10444 [Aphanomyces stellatus]